MPTRPTMTGSRPRRCIGSARVTSLIAPSRPCPEGRSNVRFPRDRGGMEASGLGSPDGPVGVVAGALSEVDGPIGSGGDAVGAGEWCGYRELGDAAAGGDAPDLVASLLHARHVPHLVGVLGEPQVAVGAGDDAAGVGEPGRDDEDAVDPTGGVHPLDEAEEMLGARKRGVTRKVGGGEPEVAVRTGGDPRGRRGTGRDGEQRDLSGRRHATDPAVALATAVDDEPEVAVGAVGDPEQGWGTWHRELGDRARGGDPADVPAELGEPQITAGPVVISMGQLPGVPASGSGSATPPDLVGRSGPGRSARCCWWRHTR